MICGSEVVLIFRWKMPMRTQEEYSAWEAARGPSDQLGGLQLFLNLQKVGVI